MQRLSNGGYAICDQFEAPGEGSSFFVFARGWLLEVIELECGEYRFLCDGQKVGPEADHFGVFYPAFAITRPFMRGVRGRVRGVGSVEHLSGLPSGPCLFETDFRDELVSVDQALDILAGARSKRSIKVCSSPSLVSIKAKRLIDKNYLVFPAISRIAGRLGVSPEHLSRQFKRDYRLTPSEYLHYLRVADATHRLTLGEEIIDISQDVGYNDLSRFYKQFRKKTNTSPALCRQAMTR